VEGVWDDCIEQFETLTARGQFECARSHVDRYSGSDECGIECRWVTSPGVVIAGLLLVWPRHTVDQLRHNRNSRSKSVIGKIVRKSLREVWPHEAYDFTKWLEKNMDVLSEIIGFTPQNPERERAAGKFNVDLVAEDNEGNVVVIENQLGKSDHDHLGKLMTYTAALNARRALWIVAEPRPEHVQAVTWLNDAGLVDFFY
jgi:RecB family endonuclease NucS